MSRLALISLLVFVGVIVTAGARVGSPFGLAAVGGTSLWQAPVAIFSLGSGEGPLNAPQVALDGRDNATAIWSFGVGPATDRGLSQAGAEADLPAGRRWTSPRTVWSSAPPIGGGLVSQKLAVDARGDAVVVWTQPGAGLSRVHADYRPAGRPWQPSQIVSPPRVQAELPRVALDGRGRALVVWRGFRDAAETSAVGLEVAARARSGSWGKPHILCACRVTLDFDLAMNASGHALVVWTPQRGGLWVAARSPQGRWAAPHQISELGGYFMTKLALNAGGTAVVSWVAGDKLEVAVRPAHGRFGPTQTIGNFPYWGYTLGLAPSGEAVVMWADDDCCLYASARSPGAPTFGREQALSGGPNLAGSKVLPAIGFDRRGNAIALWTRATNGRLYVHAAQRPAGGSFDSGSDIGVIGDDCYKHICCPGDPAVAVGAEGNAIAVWGARLNPLDATCTTVDAATFER